MRLETLWQLFHFLQRLRFASALANAADEEAVCVLKPVEMWGAIESVVDDKEGTCVVFANVGKIRSKEEVASAAYASSWDPVGNLSMPFGTEEGELV